MAHTAPDLPAEYAQFIDRIMTFPPILYTLTTAEHRGNEWWMKQTAQLFQWIPQVLMTPGILYCGFSEPQKRGATHWHGLIQARGRWRKASLPFPVASAAWNQIAHGKRCAECADEIAGIARFETMRGGERAGVRYCTKYIAKNADMIPPTWSPRPTRENLIRLTGCQCSPSRSKPRARADQPNLYSRSHRTRSKSNPTRSR